MSINDQFAILGLGQFGRSILNTLVDSGCNVLACDENADVVAEMSETATHIVEADVTEESAMRSLGLGNFDVVIIATGDSMETSIIATLLAKELGAKKVIARALNKKHKIILEKVGADRVLLPEWEMGEHLAISLVSGNIIDYLNLSDKYSIAEISPLDAWIGQSLHKADIRSGAGLSVVGIKKGKRVIISPRASEVIEENDLLVVIGLTADIQRVSQTKIKGGRFE